MILNLKLSKVILCFQILISGFIFSLSYQLKEINKSLEIQLVHNQEILNHLVKINKLQQDALNNLKDILVKNNDQLSTLINKNQMISTPVDYYLYLLVGGLLIISLATFLTSYAANQSLEKKVNTLIHSYQDEEKITLKILKSLCNNVSELKANFNKINRENEYVFIESMDLIHESLEKLLALLSQ